MIERSSLDQASLPDSMDSIEGGTNGAVEGFSTAALKRGYSDEGSFAEPAMQFPMPSSWLPVTDPWGEPDER